MFHKAQLFLFTLSSLFARLWFRLLCARLAVHSFLQTTTLKNRIAVYVCVIYSSLFTSLPFSTLNNNANRTHSTYSGELKLCRPIFNISSSNLILTRKWHCLFRKGKIAAASFCLHIGPSVCQLVATRLAAHFYAVHLVLLKFVLGTYVSCLYSCFCFEMC